MSSDIVTVECDVRARTGTGILLRFGDVFAEPIWFQRDDVSENVDGTVTMNRELAKRKGVVQHEVS